MSSDLSVQTFFRKLSCREMQFWDLFGRPVHFKVHELQAIVLNKYFLLWGLIAVALFTTVDLHDYQGRGMSFLATMFTWAGAVFALVAAYLGGAVLWVLVDSGDGPTRIFRPVLNLFAVAVASTVIVAFSLNFYSGPPFSFQTVIGNLPVNFALSYTFDVICFVFVLPLINQRYGLNMFPTANVTTQDTVVIGGKKMPVKSIRYVKSEEHYLFVHTDAGTEMVRARIVDFVEQVPFEIGMQTHRSWWVAHAEIAGHKLKSTDDVLILQDGTEVPVARGRRKEVRAALEG